MPDVVHSIVNDGRSRWRLTFANTTQGFNGYMCSSVCSMWVYSTLPVCGCKDTVQHAA